MLKTQNVTRSVLCLVLLGAWTSCAPGLNLPTSLDASKVLSNVTSSSNTPAPGKTRLQLSLAGSSSSAFEICSPYTLTVKDLDTNAAFYSKDLTVTNSLSSSFAGRVYRNSTCTDASDSLTLSAFSTSAVFYFLPDPTWTSSVTITSAVNVPTEQTATLSVTSGTKLMTPYNDLKLAVTGSSSFFVGSCTAYTIATQKVSDSSAYAAVVPLTLTSSLGSLYADASCTVPLTTPYNTAGTGARTIYLKTAAGGSPVISVSGTLAGAVIASGTLLVTSVPLTSLLLAVTGASPVGTGACTPYTITLQSAPSTPTTFGTDITLTLSGAGTGAFYDILGNCQALAGPTITTKTLTAGSPSVTVYFKDSGVGSRTLTANGTGAGATIAQGTLPVQINAPLTLAITGNATDTVGVCIPHVFALSPSPATVHSSDIDLTLSVTLSMGAFYTDSGCTSSAAAPKILAGQNSATYYFTDTVSGARQLGVSGSAANATFTGATTALTLNAGNPDRYVYLSTPTTVQLNTCYDITFGIADQYNNVLTTHPHLSVICYDWGAGRNGTALNDGLSASPGCGPAPYSFGNVVYEFVAMPQDSIAHIYFMPTTSTGSGHLQCVDNNSAYYSGADFLFNITP